MVITHDLEITYYYTAQGIGWGRDHFRISELAGIALVEGHRVSKFLGAQFCLTVDECLGY